MKKTRINQLERTPSKVVCIGRNYVDHIKELGNETPNSMVVFNKPNSAITEVLYHFNDNVRYEGEICFAVKDNQLSAVGFGLDLTQADVQNEMKEKGLPWERAKAFDNSAVLSEFVSLEGYDIKTLAMELIINGQSVQKGHYDLMMYKPEHMVAEINSFMTLNDDDIIMSGTPKGVGYYKVGDEFIGKIFAGDQLILECQWTVKAK